MKRHGATKQDREAAHFHKEARSTFGIRSDVVGVGYGADPQAQHAEAQRLAAVHDPSKPSACRLCGVTVAPTEDAIDGWKCCEPCRVLLAGGRLAVYRELVGADVARDELDELSGLIGVVNPTLVYAGRWPTDPGHAERWAHLPADLAARGRAALATMRLKDTPRPNSYGTGCAFCGVSHSTGWTTTGWHKGGRNGPRVAACAACEPWITRSGSHEESWRPALLAAATGMTRAQMGATYGLKAFWESDAPADGTAEPWAYLGETRAKLRAKVIRCYPRRVTLTDNEARILRLEASLAEAPKGGTKLADV